MWSGRIYIACVLGGAISSLALWWFGGQLTRIQETHIAELQSHTAQLIQDNLRLEAQIAARRLTQSQQKSLEALFAKFPGRTVHVSSYMQDIDAAMLGRQILQTVTSAKLQKDDMLMALSSFKSVTEGISVTGTEQAFVKSAAALLESFKLGPISNDAVQGNYMNVDEENAPYPLKIFIGVKPLAADQKPNGQ